MSEALLLAFLAACLGTSFLMSGMESGVFTLNRLRLRRLHKSGDPRARLLLGYLEQPEEFLWTILVSNTLANFAAVVLLVLLLRAVCGGSLALFWAAFLVSVFLLYAVGDLLPKLLFRLYPTRLCLILTTPFRLIHVALSPFIQLLSLLAQGLSRRTGGRKFTGGLFTSRDELRHVMHESDGELGTEERAMIGRVLDLQNVTLRQLTVPMPQVVSLSAAAPLSDALALWRERQPSRLPVWREERGRRRVVGVLNLRGVLYRTDANAARPVGEFIRPALFLDESTRLDAALARMQRGGERLAIVLDAEGRETGIVSLQDMLKFIFSDNAS